MAEMAASEESNDKWYRLSKEQRDLLRKGLPMPADKEKGLEDSLSLAPALKGLKRSALSTLRDRGAPSALQEVAEVLLPEDELDAVNLVNPGRFVKGAAAKMAKDQFGSKRPDSDTKKKAPSAWAGSEESGHTLSYGKDGSITKSGANNAADDAMVASRKAKAAKDKLNKEKTFVSASGK